MYRSSNLGTSCYISLKNLGCPTELNLICPIATPFLVLMQKAKHFLKLKFANTYFKDFLDFQQNLNLLKILQKNRKTSQDFMNITDNGKCINLSNLTKID